MLCRPKRKRRRIVNPNPLRIDHVQRNPPTESRLEAAEANLKNGTSRSRRNAVNTRVSEEASANYQTRFSRRTTSKSSNVKTESEKENLAIENGVEKSARGKVSRKHRHKGLVFDFWFFVMYSLINFLYLIILFLMANSFQGIYKRNFKYFLLLLIHVEAKVVKLQP